MERLALAGRAMVREKERAKAKAKERAREKAEAKARVVRARGRVVRAKAREAKGKAKAAAKERVVRGKPTARMAPMPMAMATTLMTDAPLTRWS
jgi:hypothetical protein